MRANFTTIFLIVTFLFAGNIICAQKKTSSTPEERATKLTEWMKTNLQLKDDQATQVHAINLKYANKTQELKTQSLSRKQKTQILKENDKAKDAELKNILTSDQFKAYQEKKEEIRKQMKERMREKKTNGR